MRTKSAIPIVISVLTVSLRSQAPQEEEKFTAREMFLAARDKKPLPSKPKGQQADPPGAHNGSVEPPAPTVTPTPQETVIPATLAIASQTLGLRYTVQKKNGGQTTEVLPDAVFHSGDRIQLEMEVSNPGYLYIISQGSSGTWKVLFPSPEVGQADNRVDGGHKYIVPKGHVITFVGNPGVEKLFVVLSRQPEESWIS